MAHYTPTEIPDVVIIEPSVYDDGRGYFFESYHQKEFEEQMGSITFLQDNESKSAYGVLRGLHYQIAPFEQAKLVRVIQGKVLDVAADIRPGSPTFGRYVSVELSGENKRQIFIPKGFAHGFVALSQAAVLQYKVDAYYSRQHERGIRYDDPRLAIDWQLDGEQIILSEKDRNLPLLDEISGQDAAMSKGRDA